MQREPPLCRLNGVESGSVNDKVMLVNSAQQSLAPGEMLRHFQIGNVLGQGSFGIAYAAQDTDLLRKVAIKEFLPVAMALREPTSREVLPRAGREGDFRFGLEQFLEGARTLAR